MYACVIVWRSHTFGGFTRVWLRRRMCPLYVYGVCNRVFLLVWCASCILSLVRLWRVSLITIIRLYACGGTLIGCVPSHALMGCVPYNYYTPVCLWWYAYRVCPLHAFMGCVPCICILKEALVFVSSNLLICHRSSDTVLWGHSMTGFECCHHSDTVDPSVDPQPFYTQTTISHPSYICHRNSDVGPAPNTPRTRGPSSTTLLHSACALCPYP